jgi:hypothetical protein
LWDCAFLIRANAIALVSVTVFHICGIIIIINNLEGTKLLEWEHARC